MEPTPCGVLGLKCHEPGHGGETLPRCAVQDRGGEVDRGEGSEFLGDLTINPPCITDLLGIVGRVEQRIFIYIIVTIVIIHRSTERKVHVLCGLEIDLCIKANSIVPYVLLVLIMYE